MSFYTWSQTADDNATADSTINFAEGQLPGSLNDSNRAAMAALAKYRDDTSGSLVTGGSSTAYTITSNQSFDSLAHLDGQIIWFSPHATCGASATLNVDSLGAKSIYIKSGTAVQASALSAGVPYAALYNNTDGVFYLVGFYGAVNAAGSMTIGGNASVTGSITAGDAMSVTSGGLNVTGGVVSSGVNEFTSTTRLLITTNSASNECLRLNQIGATAPFTFMFFQSGGVTFGSVSYNGTNTLYNATSDGRLKPKRKAFDSGPIIDALAPVLHNWTHAKDKWDYGLIAQHTKRILPQIVTKGKGSPGKKGFIPWMIDYAKAVPVIIAELKSLRARVAKLERGQS